MKRNRMGLMVLAASLSLGVLSGCSAKEENRMGED